MERYQELIERYKIPLALILVGIVFILAGFLQPQQETAAFPEQSLIKNPATVVVDISGAVAKPGIYQLQEDKRVADAIQAAGGLTSQADNQYISKYLNLAQKISDGIKIYIPVTGENPPTTPQVSRSQELININQATLAQLESLSGIGPATANKIINLRPFSRLEDLVSKKVVNKSVFEKIKHLITI